MISFVVPAYNEERLLGRTVGAIHAAAREPGLSYEVIVVDDGSTDRTAAIAEEHGCRVVRVNFRQIARTRNAGARAATGEILIFVDADTLVSSSVVRASIDSIERGVAGGGAHVMFDGRVPLWASLTASTFLVAMRMLRLAPGCFIFCSRAAFEATGGFDERMYAAEEIAFSRALQRHGEIVILRESVVTSGRKLRMHSPGDLGRLLGGVLRHGTAFVHSRKQLDVWYDGRRDDPDDLATRGYDR